MTALRDLGLVAQVFDEQKLGGLRGHVAIGHTRYSTTGSSQWANAQPLVQHGRARTVRSATTATSSTSASCGRSCAPPMSGSAPRPTAS